MASDEPAIIATNTDAGVVNIPSSFDSHGTLMRTVEILEQLDNAKTQGYHFTTILVAGCGLFTDAYGLFSISIVSNLLGRIYFYDQSNPSVPGQLPPHVKIAVSAIALCGTLPGALFFGFMGDRIGRRKAYGVTLVLMAFCSIASALAFSKHPIVVISTVCFFRFWLGFGIGGDYPLSATIMSEYSNVKRRGAFIGAVFALQGFGILFGALVGLSVSAAFKRFNRIPIQAGDAKATELSDFLWRIVLMIDAIPALLTLYFRMKLPETARYTALVEGDILRATLDMENLLDKGSVCIKSGRWVSRKSLIYSEEFRRRFGRELFGTCTTWFLLDITFYSQNLFQNDVVGKAAVNALDEVFNVSKTQAGIAVATIAGYWITVLTVEKLGRRVIQLLGFFFMVICTVIVSVLSYKLGNDEIAGGGENQLFFLVPYAAIFLVCTFGANTTTFIVPAELFPAKLRSTCYGLSAAAGKAGAVVGSVGFLYAKKSNLHLGGAFLMLALPSLLGLIVTYFCTPETKGKTLEQLSGDFDCGMMEELEPFSDLQTENHEGSLMNNQVRQEGIIALSRSSSTP